MCTGRRREVNRRPMGGRRVTADRRYENGESGDYSQDIFNLHSLSRFLFKLAFAQRISTHRESSSIITLWSRQEVLFWLIAVRICARTQRLVFTQGTKGIRPPSFRISQRIFRAEAAGLGSSGQSIRHAHPLTVRLLGK